MNQLPTITLTPGETFQVNTPYGAACGGVEFTNESGYTLTVAFGGSGATTPVNSGEVRYLPASCFQGYSGVLTITVNTILNNASSYPASDLIILIYGPMEAPAAPYNYSLGRVNNVGNTVNTVGGGSTFTQQDNTAAGSLLVESTPTGASGSTVDILTDGTVLVRGYSGGVLTTSLSLTSGGSAQLPVLLGDLPAAAGYTNRFGIGLNSSTDVGFESTQYASVIGQNGVLVKQNTYFDATNHRFVTANPAYMWDFGGSLSGTLGGVAMRQNTNTPAAGGIITWGGWDFIVPSIYAVGQKSATLNGSTSGTAIAYCTETGNYKRTIVVLNNFRNGGGATQDLTLPVAYAGPCYARTTNVNPWQAMHSGVAQSFGIFVSLAAAGGTLSSQNTMNSWSIADLNAPVDTVRFASGQAAAHTGLIIIEGQ